MPRRVIYVPGSSRKLCQLTGEWDRSLGKDKPAFNRTETRFGMFGTDLGASFEHKGRCWFLFGDTHPSGPNNEFRPYDGDSIAYTTDTRPSRDGGVRLEFVTAPDGKYLAPSAPGVSMKGFEVPTGGFSGANGSMYIFFTTDAKIVPGKGAVMARSVLLRSDDDAKSFRAIYTVSREKIIYIAPAIVDNARWKGLPQAKGRGLLLWAASTEYRRSDPYLAYLLLEKVEEKSAMRYFAGVDAKTKRPQWSEKEADAAALFSHPHIGELCVTWNPHLRQWLMLYNAGEPRGINFRVADTPWGPWSETAVLFEPWKDNGYCHFMHVDWRFRRCDEVHDPGKEEVWAGEYGPYIIDRFTMGGSGKTTIYYVMSTWNPYNTVLMTCNLEVSG